MHIQWFPGHMHKASKEIRQLLPQIDVVIEILDARIPFSSQNPLLSQLRKDKPCIKILNKTDLADDNVTQIWQAYFEQESNVKTLAINASKSDKTSALISLCHKLVPMTENRSRPIHALIMGIPNVGKSTLINALAGRMIAKTGNEPAITKHQQRIDIGHNIVLFDTPGLLWANLENRNSGYRLAATGAIKDTAFTHEDVASFTLAYLITTYSELIKQRFNLDILNEKEHELLAAIGKKRGCLKSGGLVDLDKAGKIVLNELRAGTLGKITLETPDMMQQELADLIVFREEKAAKKLARLQQRKLKK